MFYVAAIHNWIAGGVFLIAHAKIFEMSGMEPVRHALPLQAFLGLAMVYGLGYFWVARDISMNHDIVKLGILGKLIVVVLFAAHWALGNVPVSIALCASGDLIFSLLFIEFLYTVASVRKAERKPMVTS